MKYSPKVTAQKTAEIGGVSAVGVIIEAVSTRLLPGWFPAGTVTAAAATLYVSVKNWLKNRNWK